MADPTANELTWVAYPHAAAAACRARVPRAVRRRQRGHGGGRMAGGNAKAPSCVRASTPRTSSTSSSSGLFVQLDDDGRREILWPYNDFVGIASDCAA